MRLVPVPPLGDFFVFPGFGDPPHVCLVSMGFRGTLYLLRSFGNLYSRAIVLRLLDFDLRWLALALLHGMVGRIVFQPH